MSEAVLKAPFPAFGGKSQVADLVWSWLGNPRNYIEPFAFSSAVLLRRPGGAGPIETINDLNAYVANFWRAIQHDPDAVADHADWPVNETDLHARHKWLVKSDAAKHCLQKAKDDPAFFDARMAGWWCWGACCWIGSGWCDQIPHMANAGQGVNAVSLSEQIPHMDATRGVIGERKRPQLCNGNTTHGNGVNMRPRLHGGAGGDPPGVHMNGSTENHRPQIADAYSRWRGVNGNDSDSTCDRRRVWLRDWMNRLADRLRPVRVCCGHWMRVCDSDSTTIRLGTTGVFLDPPYRKKLKCGKQNRYAHIYANDKIQDVDSLCDEVQAWCLKWGDHPDMRIALCGLEGEYPEIEAAGWTIVPWRSRGGYGNRTERGKENAARERIWFSPNCQRPLTDVGLFG